ncbi:MAG: hypothetical protein H7336_11370 [Bacteriovorax sp.]|nr:hypothetical protein [Bacteriovorax sp.]
MNKFLTAAFIVVLILFASGELFAQATVPATVYMIKAKESIESVATKLLPRFKAKYGKRIEDFKRDLMEWNPHISTWDPIPMFSNIYVEYPYPVYISHKWAAPLQAETNYNVLNSDAETPIGTNKFTVFAMYTASAGTFQEQLTTQNGSIKSSQNSPLSLGAGTTIFLDKTDKMLSASGYWSSLRASKLSGSGIISKQIDAKDEIGLNTYYQQLSPWAGLSFYGGMDYEQFSTFNTTAYIAGADLAFNQNKLIYGTLGVGKTFFWDDQKILVKASLSTSLKSDTSSTNPIDKFTGQRLLFFTSIKGNSRFTYHLIYKRHMLDGPTKLTIDRIGAGIGFVVF